jgi:hypothetical protein
MHLLISGPNPAARCRAASIDAASSLHELRRQHYRSTAAARVSGSVAIEHRVGRLPNGSLFGTYRQSDLETN